MFDKLVFEPPLPVKACFYRCDSKFHLDEICDMFESYPEFGVVFTDGNVCDFYKVRNRRWLKIENVDVFLQGQFKNGGQSANRLQRKRDILRGWNLTRLAEDVVALFFDPDEHQATVKGLVLCGPAEFKQQLANHKLVNAFFPNLVAVETMVALDQRQMDVYLENLDRLDPLTKKHELVIQRLIADGDERLVFGKAEVDEHLDQCQLKTVFTTDKKRFREQDLGYACEVIILREGSKLMALYQGHIGLKFY